MAKLTRKQRKKKTIKVELEISDELNKLALAGRWLWRKLPQDQALTLSKRLLQETTLEAPRIQCLEHLALMIGFRYVMAVDEAIEQHKRLAVDAAIEQHEKSIAEAS